MLLNDVRSGFPAWMYYRGRYLLHGPGDATHHDVERLQHAPRVIPRSEAGHQCYTPEQYQ